MHLLHRAVQDDPNLRGIIDSLSERVSGNPVKRGIVIDLNPFWMACVRLNNMGISEDILFDFSPYGIGPFPFSLSSLWPWPFAGGIGPINLSDRFSMSSEMTRRVFRNKTYDGPFILRIFANTSNSAEENEHYRSLVYAARETSIPTVVEQHDDARLLASVGDQISSASGPRGTLGGFLEDTVTGKVFASTCGHVISSGTASTPSGHLGSCAHAKVPSTLPHGVSCNSSCSFASDRDIALIDVGSSAVSNSATAITSVVSPGDIVVMDGATSGTVTYEIGGAVVDHLIGGSCWKKLFLFHAPVTTGIFPVSISIARSSPPKGGDSGAWLVRAASEWAGVVVAGSSLLGFALASNEVISNANSDFGTNLKLV